MMTERTRSRALIGALVLGLLAVAGGAFVLFGDYSPGSENETRTGGPDDLQVADAVSRNGVSRNGDGAAPDEDDPYPGQDLAVSPTALLGEFTLAEEKQKYLWDIEHLAFVFGQDVVSQFKTALKKGDLSGVERLLADDFQARIFDPDAGTRQQHGPVEYASWLADDRRRTVGREGFLDFLGSLYTGFESVEHIGVHVYYFSPHTPGELDGPWRIRWNGHTSGLLADGSRVTHRFDWQFDVASMREEMKEDEGWFTGFETVQARRVESPAALFEDVTAETGIDVRLFSDNWNLPEPPYPVVPGFARLLDFDRDGHTDVLMTDMHFLHLYRGLGDGTFENVTKVSGLDEVAVLDLDTFLTGALVADLDDNGYPDVLFSLERKPGPDRPGHAVEIFRNLGAAGDTWTGFQHVPESVHRLGERYRLMARGLAAADFDNDGRVDLFLGAAGREPPPGATARWVGDQSFREGALLLNLGEFRFVDVTVASGMTGEHIDISGSTWLDLEPDGDADLFLTNHMGHNVLWENRGDGTFEKRERTPGFGGFSMGATQGDLDGDGDADVYVANMYTSAGGRIIDNLSEEDYPEGIYELIRGFGTGNELYENQGGSKPLEPLGVYADVANGGWAYGPELIDMDGDGLLDIYSPAGYQSVKRGEPDG